MLEQNSLAGNRVSPSIDQSDRVPIRRDLADCETAGLVTKASSDMDLRDLLSTIVYKHSLRILIIEPDL